MPALGVVVLVTPEVDQVDAQEPFFMEAESVQSWDFLVKASLQELVAVMLRPLALRVKADSAPPMLMVTVSLVMSKLEPAGVVAVKLQVSALDLAGLRLSLARNFWIVNGAGEGEKASIQGPAMPEAKVMGLVLRTPPVLTNSMMVLTPLLAAKRLPAVSKARPMGSFSPEAKVVGLVLRTPSV